jgi:hypothetical protein
VVLVVVIVSWGSCIVKARGVLQGEAETREREGEESERKTARGSSNVK